MSRECFALSGCRRLRLGELAWKESPLVKCLNKNSIMILFNEKV